MRKIELAKQRVLVKVDGDLRRKFINLTPRQTSLYDRFEK